VGKQDDCVAMVVVVLARKSVGPIALSLGGTGQPLGYSVKERRPAAWTGP